MRQRYTTSGKLDLGIEVFKTIDRGFGIRGNRRFVPSQMIIEYTGEIITRQERDYRMRYTYKDNDVRIDFPSLYPLTLISLSI